MEITTEPAGAEIVAVSAASGVASPLGKSPVLLDSGKIAELLRQGPAIIRATAEGFETTHLLVPTSLRGEVKASVTLKKVASDKAADAPEKKADLNALIRNILDAERSIIEKRFDDAKRLATKIREDFPALAISYFLEGSVYFKQGDRAAALASMNRGLELDPDDVVTKKFVEQFGKEQNTGAK